MITDGTFLPEPRVVVLARQAIDRVAGAEMVCVSGAYEAAAELLAARQAGADRLALVVDLGLLWPRHLGLLQVARKLEVEMLAFGTAVAGLDAEQLAGLRLVSRASLPEALAQFARHQGEPGGAEGPSLPEDFAPIEEPMRAEESFRGLSEPRTEVSGLSEPRTEVSGLSEPRADESVPPKPADAAARDGRRAKTSPAAAARLVPAKQPQPEEDEPWVGPLSLDLTLESGDREGAIPAQPPAARATQPSSLLTPEELSALLGEEDP